MAGGGARKNMLVALAAIAIALAGVLVYRALGSSESGSTESLTKDITIRCAETGEEWTLSRGRLEQALYMRPGMIDPAEGLANPTTGKPTGFPVNRTREWDEVIARINTEKRVVLENKGS